MKKLRLLSAFISAILIISTSSGTAFASSIYDITEKATIASGITIENIKRLTSAGWQNINIIEADLADGNFKLKTLTNEDNISKLTNIKDLAEANGTIAAINGDFFSWKKDETSLGSAVGGVISDGEMLTSPTSPWNFATVAQKEDRAFIFDYIDCAIAVAAPNGFITPIEHINKYDDLTQPIIYTRHWGPLSPGSAGTQKEIVIEHNKVVSVNHDMGQVEIPENGFIISFLSDITPELLENFNVDDQIELGINYEPKFENIEFAVGAGTLLLKDGEKTEIINDIAGNQPRTAIGVNRDFTKLYFVTVDGRQENAKGITLNYLADIMDEIGANDAANLDGGGSTQLVIQSPYTNQQTVANSPADKYLRKVANGIGLVIDKNLDDKRFITIKTEADRVFANTEIFLDTKLHDGTGKIIETAASEFEWDLPNGSINDGFYTPKKSGRYTLAVSLDDATAQKELHVLDNPVKLETGKKEYSIKTGESVYMALKGETADGYSAYINLRDVGITTNSSVIEIDGNNIKGVKKGTAVVTFDFEDVQTSVIIRVGGDNKEVTLPEDIQIADALTEKAKDTNGAFKFAVFGNTSSKNTLIEKLVVLKYASLLNAKDYPLAVFAGKTVLTPDSIKAETAKAGDYSYTVYKNNAFITMDNSKGSVTATNVKQWESFFKDLGSTKADNIFIILPTDMTSQTSMDMNMLCDIYEKQLESKDKKLYVISSGGESIKNIDGIKHIAVKGVDALDTPATATDDAKYYEFSVNGNKVTYEIKSVYN